jgi:hypothetical protein
MLDDYLNLHSLVVGVEVLVRTQQIAVGKIVLESSVLLLVGSADEQRCFHGLVCLMAHPHLQTFWQSSGEPLNASTVSHRLLRILPYFLTNSFSDRVYRNSTLNAWTKLNTSYL